jgi:hypothetical protein
MANSAQARKRARQSEVTRKRNATMRSTLRTAVKNVKKAIIACDKAAAKKPLDITGRHRSGRRQEDRAQESRLPHQVVLAQAIKLSAQNTDCRARRQGARNGALFSRERLPLASTRSEWESDPISDYPRERSSSMKVESDPIFAC